MMYNMNEDNTHYSILNKIYEIEKIINKLNLHCNECGSFSLQKIYKINKNKIVLAKCKCNVCGNLFIIAIQKNNNKYKIQYLK